MAKSSKSLVSMDKILEILASTISIVLGLFGLSQHYGSNTIKPSRIYSSGDAAEFLKMARLDVLKLIKSGAIQATKGGNGNYLIVGQSLINYLASPTVPSTD